MDEDAATNLFCSKIAIVIVGGRQFCTKGDILIEVGKARLCPFALHVARQEDRSCEFPQCLLIFFWFNLSSVHWSKDLNSYIDCFVLKMVLPEIKFGEF